MLIRQAQILTATGFAIVDIRCANGVISEISEIGERLKALKNEPELEARGGALLPGLHDQHIHLLALAANQASVQCGPPKVNTRAELSQAIKEAAQALRRSSAQAQSQVPQKWLRGVAYHESVAGELDCWQLDRLCADIPLRIQHRSGKLWMLNSLAMKLLGLQQEVNLAGNQFNDKGEARGRLLRADTWLRAKTAALEPSPPEADSKLLIPADLSTALANTSAQLARYGITAITDAGPHNAEQELAIFKQAIEHQTLRQRVKLMGRIELPLPPPSSGDMMSRGAVKIILDADRLPDFDDFVETARQAHLQQRALAVHCVTQTELIFALSGLIEAKQNVQCEAYRERDRIEHGSMISDDAIPLLLAAEVAVVTQANFIYERGDQYIKDIEVTELGHLYRCKSLLDAGIAVFASTDAPYGSPDPWSAMRAACKRRTRQGQYLGVDEALSPEQTLAQWTCNSFDCAHSESDTRTAYALHKTVAPFGVGDNADFCLLDRSWHEAKHRLDCQDVTATLCAGKLIYQRGVIGANRDSENE